MGRVVLLLLVALLGAACTTEAPGGATPAPSASEAPSAVALPPRPRDVPLDGVDPCSLLTEQQRAELGLDVSTVRSDMSSRLFGGQVPTCTTGSHQPATTLAIGTATTGGIEIFTRGDLAADVRPVSVQGFPAVVAVPTRFEDYCSVEVDVAPGQVLEVQFGEDAVEQAVPQEVLCQRALAIADLVMASLLQR